MIENAVVTETPVVQDQAPVADAPVVDTPVAVDEKPAAPAEKMIPQSQVSKIAAREAREAAEKTERRLRAQFEQQQQAAAQNQPSSIGGIQQQSPEDIRRMIQEEAWKMSNQAMAQRIETEFQGKIKAEMQEDPEFADWYDALNIEQHPDLVLWVNGLDNTAAVVKDIAKNPAKFSNILMLARSGSPKLAQIELKKLSASIKANQEAQKQPVVDAPLDQIRPSNIGTDNGEMSVKDYMKIFIA